MALCSLLLMYRDADIVIGLNFFEFRRSTWPQPIRGWPIRGVGCPLAHQFGEVERVIKVRLRHGGQQALGIGVARISEELRFRRNFN